MENRYLEIKSDRLGLQNENPTYEWRGLSPAVHCQINASVAVAIIVDILIPPEAEDVVSGDIGVELFRRLFAFDPADAARVPGKSQFVELIAFDAGEYVERAHVPDIFRQIPELH